MFRPAVYTWLIGFLVLCSVWPQRGLAEDGGDTEPKERSSSPWLFTPTFSSTPKVGTSIGAIGGYLHRFDEDSPTSMIGVGGSISSTDSTMLGLFWRAYFKNDTHRVTGGIGGGFVKNDYEDFLGTGLPVQTNDDLEVIGLRYLRRVGGDWFIGLQGISTNYTIFSDNVLTGIILELLGLTGFKSNALGLAVQWDTRDSQTYPTSGNRFDLDTLAFRESLGGDESFDAYRAVFAGYERFNSPHVLAYRVAGRWTQDAPLGGYSSVTLRGYTMGQYLAPYHSLVEIEGRFRLSQRFGATLFTGAACLYGSLSDCEEGGNWYPNFGGGATYLLNPEEGMIVRLEYAMGKDDNQGIYLQFGQSF